jgi:hypothetical protein
MSSVISFDRKLVVDVNDLMKADNLDFAHAVLDHFRSEEVSLRASRSLRHDFAKVLEEDRTDDLCRHRHVDWALVAHLFGHIRKRPAVVQVEMRNNYCVDVRRKSCLKALIKRAKIRLE